MLKESVAAVLFTALISGVAAQTPITITAADKDEIVRAHNFVRRGVMPSATNMEVMVSQSLIASYNLWCFHVRCKLHFAFFLQSAISLADVQ